MPGYWPLRELDERVRCRACQQEFALPAVERGGEARIAYRLDGLVARAMDQDIIPVLLALRHILRRPECGHLAQWWPGLNLYEATSSRVGQEFDLLVADQGTLRVCEVKSASEGFTREIVLDLLKLATRVGAEAVIAAPTGEWRDEVVELLDERQFLLLGAAVLMDAATA